MKILQVCNHFYPCIGGIERHVEDLCRNLIAIGHESSVVCLDTCSKGGKLSNFQEHDGIKIFRIPYLNLKIYKIAPSVSKFLKNYDIIHVHGLGFFSDFLSLTKFVHKKPLIITTHGGIFHTPAYSLLKNIYFKWSRISSKNFDRILAVSKSDERLFLKVSRKVMYVPNAVDFGSFKIARTNKENNFLYVGRISKNKRIDLIINTFAFLKKKIPDAKLYVVGEDWEGLRDELERLVDQKGLRDSVTFLGAVRKERLPEYYSKCRFFVSASEYEGFGISLLEAMAAACVAIVNDIDAFRELVANEEDGFIVDFSNPQKVSEKIVEIMKADLTRISENAREKAKKYDWKSTVRRIESIYIEVGN